MKQQSAAWSKNHYRSAQKIPKEGTKLRQMYEMFMINKGLPVKILARGGDRRKSDVINQLRDFYGLDIRCIKRGTWVLAGEWNEDVYVDYIVQHLEQPK